MKPLAYPPIMFLLCSPDMSSSARNRTAFRNKPAYFWRLGVTIRKKTRYQHSAGSHRKARVTWPVCRSFVLLNYISVWSSLISRKDIHNTCFLLLACGGHAAFCSTFLFSFTSKPRSLLFLPCPTLTCALRPCWSDTICSFSTFIRPSPLRHVTAVRLWATPVACAIPDRDIWLIKGTWKTVIK